MMFSEMIDRIIEGNCLDVMKSIPDSSIDLVVTSPPYDNLRDYRGYSFDFEGIAKELFRIMKKGGVVTWIVGDAMVDGSETGTSFRQALYFKEIGFNLHDTLIYEKNGSAYPANKKSNRYTQIFEYMFVFVKPQKRTSKVPRFDIPFSKEDSTWLAAAIDGEGCFNISKQARKNCFMARISVSNTNKQFIDKCKTITKSGSITHYPPRKQAKKESYIWSVSTTDSMKIITEIYSYLVIKKEQAKVLLEYNKIIRKRPYSPGRGSPLTKKEQQQRIKLYELLKSLNQGGVTDSGLPEPDLRIISQGGPKSTKLICDKKNRWEGYTSFGKSKIRDKYGELKTRIMTPVPAFSPRNNIWRYYTGKNYSSKDTIASEHPAIFPEKLARDHILSWSNENDIVLDPMCGSGTTCKMAKQLNRRFIGIEISKEYCDIANNRLEQRCMHEW